MIKKNRSGKDRGMSKSYRYLKRLGVYERSRMVRCERRNKFQKGNKSILLFPN